MLRYCIVIVALFTRAAFQVTTTESGQVTTTASDQETSTDSASTVSPNKEIDTLLNDNTNSSLATYNSTVSLIIDLETVNDIVGMNMTRLVDYLQKQSINYTYVTAENLTDSTPIGAQWKGDAISVSLYDVTDGQGPVVNVVSEDNVTNLLSVASASSDTATASPTASDQPVAMMLIDICGKRKNISRELFNLVTIGYNVSGLYLRIKANKTITNTSNVAYYLNDYLTVNHSYFLELDDSSKANLYWNLSRALCRAYAKNHTRHNHTRDQCCCLCETGISENAHCSNEATTQCENTSLCCGNETVQDQTTDHVDESSSTDYSTSAATVPLAGETRQSSSAAASAIGLTVVFLLVVVGIVGVVYRKRIIGFVRERLMRRRGDNDVAAVRYGSLRNKYENSYDNRGMQ